MFGKLLDFWRLYRWYKGGGVERMDTSKLKSRKLWMTIAGSVLVTLLSALGVEEGTVELIAKLWLFYLGGQAAVDVMKAKNGN